MDLLYFLGFSYSVTALSILLVLYKRFSKHPVGDHVFVSIIGMICPFNFYNIHCFFYRILSLIGVLLCIAIMFIASWYFALVAMLIAIVMYKFIEYKG